MNHIFSYIFYTLSKPYRAGLDRVHPHIGASALLSLLQAFNVITLIAPFLKPPNDKYIWMGIAMGIALLNLFIFNAKSLTKFDKRWDNELKSRRFLKRCLVAIYVIVSLTVFIYMGWSGSGFK